MGTSSLPKCAAERHPIEFLMSPVYGAHDDLAGLNSGELLLRVVKLLRGRAARCTFCVCRQASEPESHLVCKQYFGHRPAIPVAPTGWLEMRLLRGVLFRNRGVR